MVAEKEQPKEKDVGQIVRYLTTQFNQATSRLERAFRGKNIGPNRAYELQIEFAHLLNEIMQGPRAILQKNITACNEFVDSVIKELNESEKVA